MGKSALFDTISQRLDDQVRIILKKGWFSDFEVLEIYQQINREDYEQDSIRENHDWKEDYFTVSQEPGLKKSQCRNRKNKQVITKYLNGDHRWIKHGELCRGEISLIRDEPEQKVENWIGIEAWRTGKEIKTVSKEAKEGEKHVNMLGSKYHKAKPKQETNLIMQREERNQKKLAREGRLKRYRDRAKQYNQSKITKKHSTNNYKEIARIHTNNQRQKKQNNYGVKYGNEKNITERLNG